MRSSVSRGGLTVASTYCEKCGVRMGSFSFRKKVYVWEGRDGVPHDFCSEDCCLAWRREQEPERPPATPSAATEDLERLYYRKLAEYKDILTALTVVDTDEERQRVQHHRWQLKEEIEELGEILGKD